MSLFYRGKKLKIHPKYPVIGMSCWQNYCPYTTSERVNSDKNGRPTNRMQLVIGLLEKSVPASNEKQYVTSNTIKTYYYQHNIAVAVAASASRNDGYNNSNNDNKSPISDHAGTIEQGERLRRARIMEARGKVVASLMPSHILHFIFVYDIQNDFGAWRLFYQLLDNLSVFALRRYTFFYSC